MSEKNGTVKKKMKEAYHPTLFASDPTPDCIGLFETILE
jgi:hypothetical protein